MRRTTLVRQELAFRDDRFFIVACEDTYAPKQYFDSLKFRRLKIVVLATEDSKSAATHVVERLVKAQNELQVQDDDQHWLVLDTDHQIKPNHIPNLVAALKKAKQRKFLFALSNPCFETWLWLHHKENFVELPTPCDAKAIFKALKQVVTRYSKTSLRPEDFPRALAEEAARRARVLDTCKTERWPKRTGTHVYRLMEALFEAER